MGRMGHRSRQAVARRGAPAPGRVPPRLARLLDHLADGVTVQDAAGRLLYANAAAAQTLGLPTAAALLATPLGAALARFDLLDATGAPFPAARLPGWQVLAGAPAGAAIVRFRERATGAERWARVAAGPVRDRRGRVHLAVTVVHDLTTQERAEAMRAHLAAIVESSEDAIIGKTLDGVITSWNRGAERLYGYPAAEVVGRSVALLMPPERPDELPGILARLARGERIEHYETERVAKGGRRLRVSVSIAPVRDGAGRIVGAAAIARDITEREAAAAAVRRSEARLRDWFDNAPIGLQRLGPDGTIRWANPAMLELLGYAPPGYIGHHIAEFHADREVIGTLLMRLARGEVVRNAEARLRHVDGSTRDVLHSANIDWEGGEATTRWFVRDITERKRAEAALQASEESLRQLADAMPQVVWIARPDGTVTYYNARVVGFAGVTRSKAGTWDWRPAIHPDDLPATNAAWTCAVRAGAPYAHEHRILMADGTYRWHLSRAVPIPDATGVVTTWYGTATDIHALKMSETELRVLNANLEHRLAELQITERVVSGYARNLRRG